MNSENFFHPDAERGNARAQRIAAAKAICQSCPVIEQCREYAISAEERFGIWGGLDEDERKAAIAERKREVAA